MVRRARLDSTKVRQTRARIRGMSHKLDTTQQAHNVTRKFSLRILLGLYFIFATPKQYPGAMRSDPLRGLSRAGHTRADCCEASRRGASSLCPTRSSRRNCSGALAAGLAPCGDLPGSSGGMGRHSVRLRLSRSSGRDRRPMHWSARARPCPTRGGQPRALSRGHATTAEYSSAVCRV